MSTRGARIAEIVINSLTLEPALGNSSVGKVVLTMYKTVSLSVDGFYRLLLWTFLELSYRGGEPR